MAGPCVITYKGVEYSRDQLAKYLRDEVGIENLAKQLKPRKAVSAEESSNFANLTEDKDGNFVFFHRGGNDYETIKKSTGGTLATSKEEAAALGRAGGAAMYYTRTGDSENMVSGESKYAVKVPKDRVYDFNTDPENLIEEARKRFKEDHPEIAFSPNDQLAYMTKVAGERGYDMVVADWDGRTRAQTTKEFKPNDVEVKEGSIIKKPFKEEYISNDKKGYESIIPETKDQKLKQIYKAINEERNSENRYDKLYHLNEENEKMDQAEITKMIDESDISQELKDKYKEAVEFKEEKRRSEKAFGDVSKRISEIKSDTENEFGETFKPDGKVYDVEDKDDIVTLASENVKAKDLTTDKMIEFKEKFKAIIDKVKDAKIGVFRLDNGDYSIDLNTVVDAKHRENTLKFAKDNNQVSIYNGKEGEIKTGGTGETTITDQAEIIEAANKIANGEPHEFKKVEVKPTVKSKLEAFKAKHIEPVNKAKEGVKTSIENAKKSLTKLLPNVEIVEHETSESFKEAVGKDARGFYDSADGKIHINLEKANGRTVAHEVFHALLFDRLKTDTNIQDITKKMVDLLSKSLDKNPELKAQIEDFAKNYSENIKNEEKMSELFGHLADGYEGFDATTKSLVKRFLDRVAVLLGRKPFTEGDVVDMLNTLAGKLATGEEITNKDVKIVKPAKIDTKGNLEKPSVKSKENLESKKYQIIKDTESEVRKGSIVSTRTPDIEGIHKTSENIVDLKSLEKDDALVMKIAKELSSYGLSKIENVENINDARELIQDFKNSVKDNLRFLHDSFGKEVRDVAKLWYDGANKISNEIADKYGYSTDQVAGVMASLSPQMDWFKNLSLGKRVIDIYTNQKNTLFDSKMKEWVDKSTTGTGKGKKPLFSDSKEILKRVDGKKLSELDIKDKAIFIRAYDEMYNSKNYENISPNGEINGLVRKKDGTPGACGWGDFSTIQKSISILEDGSIENISKRLGEKHKVRNFFNNISDPSDPNAVTIDTHAVAAGLLLPLSGSSKEVLYNFGGSSSKSTGSSGSYPVYADAYRELAKELGILPRELQSITWEAVRGLFKVDFKLDKSNEKNVKEVWSKYKNGEISIDKAHSDVSDLAGGISKPIWYEYVADDNVKSLNENSAAMDQANEDSVGKFQETGDYADMKDIVKDLMDDGKSITDIKKIISSELGPEQVSLAERAHNELTEVPVKEKVTSIKNAVTETERAERGLAPVEQFERYNAEKNFNNTKERVESGDISPRSLAKAIIANPKGVPITHEVSDALAYDRMRLSNEHEKALNKLDKDPTDAAAAIDIERIEKEMEENDKAAKMSGTISALALLARKNAIKQDYSLDRMILRSKAKNKGEISADKRAEFTKLAKEIKEAEAKSEAHDNKIRSTVEDRVFNKIKNAAAKEGKKTNLKTERESLYAKLREIRFPKGKFQDIEPTELPDNMGSILNQLAKNLIMDGVTSLDGVVDDIHENVKDIFEGITKREIRDQLSGYGKVSEPSKNEIDATLREVKSQGRLVSALEDVESGKAPLKTGFQRGTPSDEVRRLQAKVQDLMKQNGITSESMNPEKAWKTALDGIKTRLKNQIKDLEKQIITGEKTAKKTGVAYDEEAQALKEHRDALKATIESVEGKREISDEQRVKMAVSALEKSIAEYERRVSERDTAPKPKGTKTPETDEIKTLKGIRDNVKAEYEQMKQDMDPKKTPEERALATLKTRLRKREAELQEKLDTGNFEKKQRRITQPDEEGMKLKANVNRLKNKVDIEMKKQDLANRPKYKKALDFVATLRRTMLLTGVKVLGKLSAAAASRTTISPIEEITGGVLSKIPGLSKIAKQAPREGGFNAKAEVKAISQWWQKATYEDMREIVKSGKGMLDLLHGKEDIPPSVMDFFGQLHQALKQPAKRNEYFRSFEKRMNHAADNGIDIMDPVVQATISTQAYMDANRAIFMQDNIATKAYKTFIASLERGGNVGETAATGLKIILPIVKVPTNYVGEVTSYAGGYAKALPLIGKALVKGTKSLTPEQSDYVMRNLKKGSLGAAMIALGYFNAASIGGYYQRGEKRDEEDVKAGGLRLFGQDMPRWLVHTPLFEMLQIGATLKRVQDTYEEKGKEEGKLASGLAVAKGLVEEVPFARSPEEALKALTGPKQAKKYAEDLGESFINPQLAQDFGLKILKEEKKAEEKSSSGQRIIR